MLTEVQGPFSLLECPPSLSQSPLYPKGPVALQTLELPLTEALSRSAQSSKA